MAASFIFTRFRHHTSQRVDSLSQKSQWTDWRWQLASSIRNKKDFENYLQQNNIPNVVEIMQRYDFSVQEEIRLTPFLLSLVDWSNPCDPIAAQHLPSKKEHTQTHHISSVWEQTSDFLDQDNRMLQKKYPDIVVLRLSNTCHSYCRFCFEKERTLLNRVPTKTGEDEFQACIEIIQRQPNIRQVLVTGGDPLVLPDNILLDRVEKLLKIPQIRIVRINSRAWLHNPFRFTAELAEKLGQLQRDSWTWGQTRGKEIHLGTHFNHPNELTPEALAAVRLMQQHGLHIYNQTVLLKNINDSFETIFELFKKLREENVRLHYFSHAMPVPGTEHLRTPVRKGQEIMQKLRQSKEFRGQLPHYEMSHVLGKQIVPDSMNENFYEATKEKSNESIIRFLSDITGQWEEYPDGKG